MSASESSSEREEFLDENGQHDEALPLLDQSERHSDERRFGSGHVKGWFNKLVFGDLTDYRVELLQRKHYIVIGILFSLGLIGFIVMTAVNFPKLKHGFI